MVAAAIVAAAAGAGGTALALGPSSPSHVASMPAAGRAQAALKITSGTPVLDISVARLDGTRSTHPGSFGRKSHDTERTAAPRPRPAPDVSS